ncbi:preprotein translocase subunit YajC [bacterium]|nr:preprotein translocase subunit YajC [bacterium]
MNPASQSPFASMLFPIILIYIIFYFVLIRPQRKEQKEHKGMIENLKKNDEVITNGGIHGTIVNVKDNSLVLKIDDNVKIEIQKSSIATIKKSRQS